MASVSLYPRITNPRRFLQPCCAIAVLPVPASVLSLGAGAIFGLVLGTLLVWSGATIGLIGCLLVGRCGLEPLRCVRP